MSCAPGTTDSNLYPANGAPINDHLSLGNDLVFTSTIPPTFVVVSFTNSPPCSITNTPSFITSLLLSVVISNVLLSVFLSPSFIL